MGIGPTPEEREQKRAAGKKGAAARLESLKRKGQADKAARDHSAEQGQLDQELAPLRIEFPGRIEQEFLDLAQVILEGIIWKRQYPTEEEHFYPEYTEDGLAIIEKKYFDLSPDWCAGQLLRIAHTEIRLPDGLVNLLVKTFERFLEWSRDNLKYRLDHLPEVAEELEQRKLHVETFNQARHDEIKKQEQDVHDNELRQHQQQQELACKQDEVQHSEYSDLHYLSAKDSMDEHLRNLRQQEFRQQELRRIALQDEPAPPEGMPSAAWQYLKGKVS